MTAPMTFRGLYALAALAAVATACSDEARLEMRSPEQMGGGLLPDGEDDSGERDTSGAGAGNAGSGSGGGTSSSAGSAGDPGAEDPGDTQPDPPAFTAPRGPCESSARVGGFTVEKQVDFGVVQGVVRDGVVPTAVPELVQDDGRCRLLERRNLACFPACVGQETCGEAGTCIPFPRQVSVGEVTILGLTRETVMTPLMPGNSYLSPGASNPPYEVESRIVLSAAGDGSLPPFDLFGIGSEPLSEAPVWVLTPGADLVLEWAAPSVDVATTVLVELSVDQHGITPLTLSCELEDTGSATIPAATVDRLITSGVTGFPNGRIVRRTVDHVELAIGCVDLAVGSPLAASVSVSGFTPCNGPADCPSGQSCNVALQRCE